MLRRAQTVEEELPLEEALALLGGGPTEPEGGLVDAEPELGDDEALAELQGAVPQSGLLQNFAGSALETMAAVPEMGAIATQKVGGVLGTSQESPFFDEWAGGLRGAAQMVDPAEARGRGGLPEDLARGAGSIAGALPAMALGGGAASLQFGAQQGVPLYYDIKAATGDEEAALWGLVGGYTLGQFEKLGVEKALSGTIRRIAASPGASQALVRTVTQRALGVAGSAITETGTELGQTGGEGLLMEALTDEDVEILQNMKRALPVAATLGTALPTLFEAADMAVQRGAGARQAASPDRSQGIGEGGARAPEDLGPGRALDSGGVLGKTDVAPLAPAPQGKSVAQVSEEARAGLQAPAIPGVTQEAPQGQPLPQSATEASTGTLDVSRGTVDVEREIQETQEELAGLGTEIRQAAMEPELKRAADIDSLTGALRRDKGIQRTGETVREARREGKKAVLLFADYDNFKAVNSAFGTKGGDEALRVASQAMQKALREGDLVRWGGDEFAAPIKVADEASAEIVRARLEKAAQEAIDAAGFGEANGKKIGLSVGWESIETSDDVSSEEGMKAVLSRAEAKMKARKAERGVSKARDPEGATQTSSLAPAATKTSEPKPSQEPVPAGIVEMAAGPPSPFSDNAIASTGRIKKALKRWLVSEGDTPTHARRELELSKGFERAEIIEAAEKVRAIDTAARKHLGRKWRGLPIAKQVDAAFEGEADAVAALPEEVQSAVADARAHLDRLIRLQVKEGGPIDPSKQPEFAKKILASQGTYARRSYRAHMDPEWADKVPADVRQRLFDLWQSWAKELPVQDMLALKRKSLERPAAAKSALARRREINREIAALPKNDPRVKELRAERKRLKPTAVQRTEAGWKARTELQGRKRFKGATETEIQGEMDALLKDAKESAENPWQHLASGKLGRKDLSIYKRRKDVPAELRAFLGEVEDPISNYANSVVKIAGVIARHEAYSKIKAEGLGKWLHEKPTGAHTAKLVTEGNKSLGPLDGLYTTPEIKKALREVTPGDQGLLVKSLMRVNSAIKWGKVLGQPWAFMRNLQSNVGLIVANGHLPGFYRTKEWAAALGKGDLEERKRLTRLGVVGSGISTAEWQDLRGALKQTPDELVRSERSPIEAAKRGVETLYEAADNAPKIRFFYAEQAHLEKAGYSKKRAEELAAERTRDLMPTTERMGEVFKRFRRQPLIGAFFAFNAEIVRTTGNRLRLISQELKSANPEVRLQGARRAVGQLLAASATPALVYAVNSLNGIDADEDEDRREFVPPWDKGSALVWFGTETKGGYINPSSVDPFSLFTEPLARVLAGADPDEALTDWVKQEAAAFFGLSPVAKLGGELAFARKLYEDPLIALATGAKPDSSPIDDRLAHMIERAQPGFAASAKRALKAPGREALAVTSGHRQYDFDVEKSLGFDVSRFGAEITEVTKAMNRQTKKSPEDAAEFKALAEKERKTLFKELSEKTQAAIRLGVPAYKVRHMLDESLSKEVTNAILLGTYIPHKAKK